MAESSNTAHPSSKPVILADGRPNVSAQLAKLKFEAKQNKDLPRLPSNMGIQRRPLLHPPVPSPQTGRHAPKCVYVSCNTPIMSAVKRVRKLLHHVEKRAMQDVDLVNDRQNAMKKLAEANEMLVTKGEKVYVKASGKAMQQALRIAEWFRRHENEVGCRVEVSTGSVQVIDDLLEVIGSDGGSIQPQDEGEEEVTLDTTDLMDTSLLSNDSDVFPQKMTGAAEEEAARERGEEPQQKKRRKKRRRQYEGDEVPEARIRWIKTIEVAISIKA